jgi:hypothetical protein
MFVHLSLILLSSAAYLSLPFLQPCNLLTIEQTNAYFHLII